MASNDVLFDLLTRFAGTISDHVDVADVLYGLTDHTVQVLDASGAGVSLADDNDSLQFVSANSEMAAELERVQQESRQGPCHLAFTFGTAVIVDDIDEHGEWPIYRSKAEELGLHAVIGIPLLVGVRKLGALNIYQDRVRAWSEHDVEAARILANIATSYVRHASELDEAQRVNEQLQQALDCGSSSSRRKACWGEFGISVDAGFMALRHHARNNQATLRSVAEAVVKLGLRPKPPQAN